MNIEFAGTHQYNGAHAPVQGQIHWNTTFSLGIFEWVPKVNGKECKKGKVKVRVRGLCNNAPGVFNVADRICKELDAGTYTGKKTVTVGTA
jgi:hypothetical protein